jgi:hypothetical protein
MVWASVRECHPSCLDVGEALLMCSKPRRSVGRGLEAAGRWPRPRSRRAFHARDVPRRRSVRCGAPVSRFRGSRLRRGARLATRGASREAAADPRAEREAPALLRRAESRHRRSAGGARGPRPSRRRESPVRPLRAATRRQVAIEPAAARPRGTRMRQPPTGGRSRPSGRTRRPWSARRREGSVERARDTRSRGPA